MRSPSAVIADYSDSVPVDLEGLATHLGLVVSYDSSLSSDVSGKITKSSSAPSGFSITVNANDLPRRRRFTLAHEIAHYVLHRDLIDSLVDNAMYRSSLSTSYERQANQYAAKILLPAPAVTRAYRSCPDPRRLANMFDVSQQAMRIRLEELGL